MAENSSTNPNQKTPAAGQQAAPAAPPPPSPVVETPPPQPPPPPVSQPETFVVPPSDQPTSGFVPQAVSVPQGNDTQPQPQKAPHPAGGSGFFSKIIILLVILLVIGGAIFGGRYLLAFLESSKQVTVTYWGLWENDAIIKPVIADFEKANPKIKIIYQKQAPREYRQRLTAAITRGEGPDVFRFHNTWVPMLRDTLDAVPADVMNSSQFNSTFYPVMSQDLVAAGTIYGIPLMVDGLGLYINEDLFAAAGVTPPTSWEDIVKVGGLVEKLTVKEGDTIVTSAIALGTAGNVEHYSDIIALMMLQNGVDLRLPQGKLAEDTLTFYRKFSDPADPVYTWNEKLDNSVYAFATGKVAMILAPSWRAFDIKQINSATRFRIVPVPQLPCDPSTPCTPVTWASYWVEGVSSKTKLKKQAWLFAKYLTSAEAASKLFTQASKTRLFGEPYARVELGKSVANDPNVGAFVKQAETAKSFPLASRTHDGGLNDNLIKYIEDAVNAMMESASAQDVLEKTVVPGFTQVLSKYGLVSSARGQGTQ